MMLYFLLLLSYQLLTRFTKDSPYSASLMSLEAYWIVDGITKQGEKIKRGLKKVLSGLS